MSTMNLQVARGFGSSKFKGRSLFGKRLSAKKAFGILVFSGFWFYSILLSMLGPGRNLMHSS